MSASRKEQLYENWIDKHLKWLCGNTFNIGFVRIYAGDGILDVQSDNEIMSCTGSDEKKFSILYNEVKKAGFTKIDVIIGALEKTQQTQVANEFKYIKEYINKAVAEHPEDADEVDKRSEILDFVTNETPLIVSVKPKSGSNNYATSKTTDNEYRNVSDPLGLALIILNENYPRQEMKRTGATNDLHYMLNLFKQLKYNVILKRDVLSPQDVGPILDDFKDRFNKVEVDSCVVICMGHGESNGLIMINGQTLNIWTDLIYKFDNISCPQLLNKPKIFIFQACQNFSEDNSPTSMNSIINAHNPPDMSDVCVCLSTLPGCVSLRDPYLGSWFIYCLTETFMNHAYDTDFENLIRKTDNRMSKIQDGNNLKQRSGKYTIAFKKFYFNVQ